MKFLPIAEDIGGPKVFQSMVVLKKFAQCASCELNFTWVEMRTATWEIAFG